MHLTNESKCELCNYGSHEILDLDHFLLDCPFYEKNARNSLLTTKYNGR